MTKFEELMDLITHNKKKVTKIGTLYDNKVPKSGTPQHEKILSNNEDNDIQLEVSGESQLKRL